jgi:hypothetical protein
MNLQQALQDPKMAQALEAALNSVLHGGAVPVIPTSDTNPQVGRVTQMLQDPKNGALYPRSDEFELTEGLVPVHVTCGPGGKLQVEKVGDIIRKEGDGMVLVKQAVVDADGNDTGEEVSVATGITGGFTDDDAVNSKARKKAVRRAAAGKGDERAADGILSA